MKIWPVNYFNNRLFNWFNLFQSKLIYITNAQYYNLILLVCVGWALSIIKQINHQVLSTFLIM